MSSTFTSPIRIFKRNNPTNDGTIAPDNTGAAVCSQQVAAIAGTAAEIVIPAGSIIHAVQFYATTTGTSRAIDIDGTAIVTLATTSAVNTSSAFTNAALTSNVGDVDVVLTAGTDTSVGVFSVTYTARNVDGTITPYGSGYTNN